MLAARIDHEKIIMLGRERQTYDVVNRIEHTAEGGSSRQTWRSVADAQATLSFSGKIAVARAAQKTDAEQSVKALLLERTATVNAKPWTAPPQGAEINAWLAIDADGNVSIRVPHTEMGQGALTGQGNPGAAQYARLLKRLYDAGVPIVAGTDGGPYNLKLELYQHSGIPAPAVLQIATIGAARVMKDDRDYGSIAVGKVADVIIVNGRPAEQVADLRKIERVFRAGRMYEPQALRSAATGTP